MSPLPENPPGFAGEGLSRDEASRRLERFGFNEIPEERENATLKFLGYFWRPIPWMIEAAVILSALTRHWADFAIILVLLLTNALVGFWEEHEAGNAIAALKKRLALAIAKANGFAQVFPEHKYHLVDVLQKRGHITGMTGDGVNDAPALKKADVGIAVSGATDAARAAAAIVLLTPGLSVIIEALQESRKIFQRMNSYAIYRISETIRVLLFMTLSILVFNFYPVTAVMIVLLALLNDSAIFSIAYDRVKYSDQPAKWNMPVVLGMALGRCSLALCARGFSY